MPALLQTEAIAVHLQDVDVVGKAVEQGSGEALGAEDFSPFGEGQVAGDHGGAALVTLAEGLEEQFRAGLGEQHEAMFIDDEQIVAGHLLLEAEQLLLVAGLDQFADQCGGGDEADAMPALAGRQAERQRDVRLAGAAVAQQQDVFLARQELAACQFEDQRFVQRGDDEEVEAV